MLARPWSNPVPDIYSILGWIGMVMLLWAYARRESLEKRSHAALNLVGAILICVVCFVQAAWPPFVLNCIWALIAVRDIAGPNIPSRAQSTSSNAG